MAFLRAARAPAQREGGRHSYVAKRGGVTRRLPVLYCAPWLSTAGSRRAATGARRDPKTCRQTVTDRDRRSTRRTAAYLGVLTGSHGLQCLGIPPGNCSVGSDTEEDGGSTPPAPTICALSRAFSYLRAHWWTGPVGEEGSSGRRALNCLTEGVLFRGESKQTHASRIANAKPVRYDDQDVRRSQAEAAAAARHRASSTGRFAWANRSAASLNSAAACA
jgi:hypothetical protein